MVNIPPNSRAARLGLIGANPPSALASFQQIRELEPARGPDPRLKDGYVNNASWLMFDYYLLDEFALAREWAVTLLKVGDDFFFGEWREKVHPNHNPNLPFDRTWWDVTELWVDRFDMVMLAAAALPDWPAFDKFARYLRDDVELNIDQHPSHRAWWLYFCGRHNGRHVSELAAFRETVIQGSRKAEKLLLTWVDALFDGTLADLQTAMDDYFRHHARSEVKKLAFQRVAIRGSMLLHLGLRINRVATAPAYAADFLVEFPGGGRIGAGVA